MKISQVETIVMETPGIQTMRGPSVSSIRCCKGKYFCTTVYTTGHWKGFGNIYDLAENVKKFGEENINMHDMKEEDMHRLLEAESLIGKCLEELIPEGKIDERITRIAERI